MRLPHIAVLAFIPSFLQAQSSSPAVHPAGLAPVGDQLVAVFLGASEIGLEQSAAFTNALRQMRPALAAQAAATGRPLSVVGVALDWDPDKGIAFLRDLGRWDEIIAGNNWRNLGAEQHIWRSEGGRATVPQIVLYERVISGDLKGMTFGPNRMLRRIVGTDSIIAWVNSGAAIR